MTVIEGQVEEKPVATPRRRKLPESNIREVAVRQPQAVQPANPMTVVERAIEKGITGQDLKELMDLQERWEANQARKAFNNALADAKAELPILNKNRLVDFENSTGKRTTYRHEDLAEVVRVAVPIISKFGLSHRYRLRNKPGEPITVTCILSHRDGYAEENELTSGPDTSGGKNAIQAIKSAITYMERITFLASLGLASSDDDDGRAAGGETATITALQLHELEKLAAEVNADIPKACKALKIESLAEMPANVFERAKASLEAKRAPL